MVQKTARHKITLLPGDGIGPEVTASVVSIIECAGVDVEWEKFFVGARQLWAARPWTLGRVASWPGLATVCGETVSKALSAPGRRESFLAQSQLSPDTAHAGNGASRFGRSAGDRGASP